MNTTSQDRLFLLIMTLLTLAAVYLLSPVLSPFLTGILFAYLANPVVNLLMRTGLSRTLCVTIVFSILLALIVLTLITLVPFIERQIILLIDSIPAMITWLQMTALPWLSANMNVDTTALDADAIKKLIFNNFAKAGGITAWVLESMFQSGAKAVAWVLNLLLIPVVAFYFLCDWQMIIENTRDLLPARNRAVITKLMIECNNVVSEFLRGQFIVMLALGVIYAAGLTLAGLQMGLLIGIIAGLLSIIPYLGFIVGIIAASIAAFFQFGSLTSIGIVIVIFMAGQTIDHFYLTPKLVGNRIGLHPVAVIFAILAGSCLFGFTGALLALPSAAVLMVWARYWHKQLV